MPNDQIPECKIRTDDNADIALKQLDKVEKAHPDLVADLKPVRDNLKAIAMDNHKPR